MTFLLHGFGTGKWRGTHIPDRNIWLSSLMMASFPFMETFLRPFNLAGNFEWGKSAVSTTCSISRLGAQMLILQGSSLRLAIVNSGLKKTHKEGRRKGGKEKRSNFWIFFVHWWIRNTAELVWIQMTVVIFLLWLHFSSYLSFFHKALLQLTNLHRWDCEVQISTQGIKGSFNHFISRLTDCILGSPLWCGEIKSKHIFCNLMFLLLLCCLWKRLCVCSTKRWSHYL